MKPVNLYTVTKTKLCLKSSVRYLLLIVLFSAVHFCATAQVPVPKWVDEMGGANGNAGPTAEAIDQQGNIYITGGFIGTVDFDPSSGVKNLTSTAGETNIFIAKYTSAGTLVWAEFMPGNGNDSPFSIAVDKTGNVTIVGHFTSSSLDADPGSGVYNLSNPNNNAIFINHLDTNGNFLWANSYEGGLGQSIIQDFRVAADSQGNVISTITFNGTSITVGDSTYTVSGGDNQGVIVKYSPTGKVLWNVHLVDNEFGQSIPYAVTVDSQDNVLVSGLFGATTNFNPLGTPSNLSSQLLNATFIAKYSPSGILIWANAINCASYSGGVGSMLSVDPENNVFLSLLYQTSISFGSTTLTSTLNTGVASLCFAKYSSAGNLQFVKSLSGPGGVVPIPSAVDNAGNLYEGGSFNNTVNFNPNTGTAENLTGGGFYIAKYDPNGNYIYVFDRGSAACGPRTVMGIAIDGNNNLDVAGQGNSCSTTSNSGAVVAQYGSTASETNVITAPAVTSFCTSGTPGAITGNLPTSGALTYQWQSSPDSVNFTNIAGADSINYTPKTLTTTTYYRRVVSGNSYTGPANSNIVGLHITPPPAAPVIAADTVCSGTTATLTVTSPQPGITYNWYANATTDIALFTGTTFTTPALTTASTYYVSASADSGCTSATRTAVTVSILPSVAAPVIPADTICAGSTATLTITSPQQGVTYNWYTTATTDTALFTGSSFTTPALTTSITYYVSAFALASCGSATRTAVTVTVLSPPVAPVVPADTTCSGTPATLAVTSPQAGVTYNWYANATTDTSLFAGASFTTPALTTSTTYYVSASVGPGCTSATRTSATVTISSALPAPRIPADTICSGSTATLAVVLPQPGITYNWYTNATTDTVLFAGTSFSSPALTAGTTYYVSASAGSGCSSATRTAVTVSVVSTPQAPVVPADTTCSGTPATLAITSPQQGITYKWYANASTDTSLFAGTSFTTPALTASTTYYVAASASSNCTLVTRTAVTVTVLSPPPAPAVPADTTCSGTSATLAVTLPQPGITYNWYANATTDTSLFAGASFTTPALTTSTTYYVSASAGAGCASATRSAVAVTVPPALSTPVVPTDTICSGLTATLTVTSPQPGVIYNWYANATSDTSLFAGASFTTPALTASTTYYVAASSGSACTSATRTVVTVTVSSSLPGPQVLADTICPGFTATLAVLSPQQGVTYNWYPNATTDTSLFAGATFTTPALTASATYYISASAGSGCTSASRTAVTVNVLTTLSAPVVPADTICPGGAATLSVASPQPDVTYSWYSSPTTTTPLFAGVSFTTPALAAATTYYVSAANALGCGSSALTPVTVSVSSTLPAPQVAADTVCAGSTATLSVLSPQPGITYNWYANATTDTSLFAGVGYTTPALTSGTTYYVSAAGSAGCASATRAAVSVTVLSALLAPVVAPDTVCSGAAATLSVTSPQEGATYNWYTNATTDTVLFSGASFTTPVLTAGTTYYVSAAIGTGCVSATRTAATVNILPALAAPVVGVDSTTQSSVTFSWAAVPGATGYQVSTDNGSTFTNPTSGAAGLTTTLSGLQPGQGVSIIVYAVGSTACQVSTNSASVTGTTTTDLIYVPNAFTPNGDGVNDVVHVHSPNIASLKFNIYDQWGELLFTSTSMQQGWDGTFKGTKEPIGVYVYILQATMNDGRTINKKGTITILK